MDKIKMLNYLKNNKVEEAIKILEREIYYDSLKESKTPSASKRATAMSKYFSYYDNYDMGELHKPHKVFIDGEWCTLFINGYSVVKVNDELPKEVYYSKKAPHVVEIAKRCLKSSTYPRKVDIGKLFATAKSNGYKFGKTQFTGVDDKFFLKCNNYYRLALIDSAYRIIDDGSNPVISFISLNGGMEGLVIENNIGKCVILPLMVNKDRIELIQELYLGDYVENEVVNHG